MSNLIEFTDCQGNSVVINMSGSGMSFDKKLTQTYIETCIKNQDTTESVKIIDTPEIKYDEVQLIMVEFSDNSLRFEVRFLKKDLIVLEKLIGTIGEALEYFYEHS
ncbi:hypothetical protein [Sulfurimonas sp.]|uniref:hypothetical protein n=1 Tax=Sulfurimonas sp. TaxID=2022749 RepID=UPI002B481ECC|nr:hypothetical protein [Sulfurimonas sp.]